MEIAHTNLDAIRGYPSQGSSRPLRCFAAERLGEPVVVLRGTGNGGSDSDALTTGLPTVRTRRVPENHRKLFETAVRPLADNAEMQLAAISLLEKTANKSQEGADGAISRWDAVDSSGKHPVRKWLFVITLLGFSGWAWTVAGKEALVYWRLDQVSAMHRYFNDPDYSAAVKMLDNCLPEKLTQHERWLLLGDATKSTRVEAMKALCDSARDDPAFYLEYVFSVNDNSRRGGPLDFLETARRFDPGNSWPFYVAGALQLGRAVEPVKLTPAEREAKVVPSWKILDQGKLDECIALLHEASLQPGFDTYQGRLIKMRKGLIPVEDHLGYLTAGKIFWLDYWGNHSPCGWLGVFLPAAAAKSQQLVAVGDKEGFVRLMLDVELLNRRWVDGEINGAGAESAFSKNLWMAIPRLHASAVSLGLARETARLDEILAAMQKLRQKDREEDSIPDGFHDWFDNHSSTLLDEFWRFYSEMWYPKWTVDELKPGRMADHEILSRGCCLAVWLIFGLSLGLLALYRIRLPRLIKRLAARIGALLDPLDHAWIIGAGVLLPYVYTMMINRFTPLGGREWSIYGNHLVLPMAQFFAMAVLMLMVPILIARWRLGKKAAVLGMTGETSAWGPRAVVCAAALVPVSGWFAPREPGLEWYILLVPLAFFLVVFPLLWLVVNSCRALFGTGELRLLGRAIISRALIPAYATAMLLMVAAAPFHKAAERAWFRRDTTMTAVPGFPAVSPYDYAVAKRIRQDIREVLGMK